MISPDVASRYSEADIEQVNTEVCSQQPFFASTQAAQAWLTTHPGGRVIRVRDVLNLPLFTHVRDTWRPQILTNA